MQLPELPDKFIPAIGQQFETFDKAYNFYNTYARHAGFGIKKNQRNKTGKYLRCVCEGNTAPILMNLKGRVTR